MSYDKGPDLFIFIATSLALILVLWFFDFIPNRNRDVKVRKFKHLHCDIKEDGTLLPGESVIPDPNRLYLVNCYLEREGK